MFKDSDDLIKELNLGKHDIELHNGMFGIEREALRIDEESFSISQTVHPAKLGSSFSNKFITTDFSESLLELITPPLPIQNNDLSFLENLHHFVSLNIENEILWPYSIPPTIKDDNEIPIAYYGLSNHALFKRAYRRGLAQRYGKIMQACAGLHFNYSFSEKLFRQNILDEDKKLNKNFIYFRALRNLHRMNWMILYFTGASPIVTSNFVNKSQYDLKKIDQSTYYLPYSTSLRMSDLGYSNIMKSDLSISLDTLESYIKDLRLATATPSSLFQNISTDYTEESSQINTNILQIEDEYYATSRPKSDRAEYQRTIENLAHFGVNYIELRSPDINPFERVGIDKDTVHFLEMLVIYCALKSSPIINNDEKEEIKKNDLLVCTQGRKTESFLMRKGKKISIKNWAFEILDDMQDVANYLNLGNVNYSQILLEKKEQIANPELTLSSRLLELILKNKVSYSDLALELADKNKRFYKQKSKTSNKNWMLFVEESKNSKNTTEMTEKADDKTYNNFVKAYFNDS